MTPDFHSSYGIRSFVACHYKESRYGRLYRVIYEFVCGRHPHLRPWHFQYLAGLYLHRSLKELLPHCTGRILDVGCGKKPYGYLLRNADEYIGIDIESDGADVVIGPDGPWPFPDQSFDWVICTQVLEHVENPDHLLGEIARVLRPGGKVILSFPFLYNEHGVPDFRRLTVHGARNILPFEIVHIERQGGFGSTAAILTLNWINDITNLFRTTRIIKAIFLPVWVMLSFVLNTAGFIIDYLDLTGKYYNNVLVVFKKPTGVNR